ncbi:MAG: hypothetical protein J6U69_01070 [Alistipes sp.]|nr:hypothetical protein [Alistipes sp.]
MKARILALLAMVLGVVSCQTEPEGLDVNVGGEQEVAVCVSLPETTRATDSAEGAFANVDLSGDATIRYILKIYQKVGNDYVASHDRQVEYSDGTNVVFPVRLVPNRDYRFVVWADYVEGEEDIDYHYNTEDLKAVRIIDENTLDGHKWNAMDETRDAFTGYFDTEEKGKQFTSTSSINITLKRPFAKLRVITTDMKELGYLGINPAYATVEYATEYRAGFNAFESKAFGAGSEKKSHSVFRIADYNDNVANTSKVLFTDYFFAEDDVVKFTLSVYEDEAKTKPIKSNFFNTDIAVKRNYLTTISGNILTDGNNINVEVKPEFDKPAIDEIVWDGKSVKEPAQDADGNYIIYEGAELAWVADQVNGVTRAAANTFKGKTIKLMKDINLGGNRWTPIGLNGYDNIFNGTFDGQGHTIVNLVVNNNKCAGLFGGTTSGTFKNLTIDGVELITNHFAGAIVAWTESGGSIVSIDNCHVKNAKITVTPELVNGKYDNGDKAGAIVGHAYATDINRCTAENIEITAFRDVAGIAGYASKRSITNCSVKNAVITSDQIHEYDGDKDGNAGVIVGRIGDPVTLEGNTTGENVVVIRKVDSTKEFEYALAERRNDDVIYVGKSEVVLPTSLAVSGINKLTVEGLDTAAAVQFSSVAGGGDGGLNCYADGTELIFKNIKVVSPNTGSAYTGGFGRAKSVLFDNCYYEGQYRSLSYVKFNKCTIDPKTSYIYTDYSNADFVECTFNCSEGKGIQVYNDGNTTDTTINVTDCTFTAAKQGQTWDGKPVTAIDINSNGEKFTVNINNSTATDFPEGLYSGESLFNIKGGAENVTIKIDGNTWVGKGVIKDENDNYVVNSFTTLETALESAGAAGAGNTTIVFAENAELNMTDVVWTPIKVDGYNGADIVTIEGNGAVITGLKAPLFAGGFAGGSGIVIKNLTIKDSDIVSANTLGSGAFIESVDSMAKIELTNCHLLNSTVTGGAGSRTGGLIGWTAGYSNQNDGPVKTYVTIDGCSVIGCTITCDGSVGGINGHAGNNDWTFTTIKNCTINNNTLASTDDGEWRVGVVVGTANVGEVTISNITESGNTLSQTGKTAPEGEKRNYYGRFVPGTTGKLTIDGEEVIIVNSAENLAKVIENAQAGDTITIAGDITLTETVTIPAGVIFNGNGKQINGTLKAGGDITFAGHTKVTAFSAGFNGNEITIDEGACLEITGGGRSTMGYNNTFNITGTITDAKSVDKANIQPSLIMPAGISITGGNGLELNIKDAYVQLGSTTSKNSAANGTFTINIENSIAEFTNQLTFAEPTSGMNPTFNLNVKNSVLTTATKLILTAKNCNMVVDNSKIEIATYFRNSGTVELKNGSVLNGSTIQFGENGGHDGKTIVDNSKFTIIGGSTGHAFDGKGTGSITFQNGAVGNIDYYKALTINTDATSTFTGTEVM